QPGFGPVGLVGLGTIGGPGRAAGSAAFLAGGRVVKRAPVHTAGPCGVERPGVERRGVEWRGVEWRGPLSRPGPVYRVQAQADEVLTPVHPGAVGAARDPFWVFVAMRGTIHVRGVRRDHLRYLAQAAEGR